MKKQKHESPKFPAGFNFTESFRLSDKLLPFKEKSMWNLRYHRKLCMGTSRHSSTEVIRPAARSSHIDRFANPLNQFAFFLWKKVD